MVSEPEDYHLNSECCCTLHRASCCVSTWYNEGLLLVRKFCNSPNLIRQFITLSPQTHGTRFVIRIHAFYLY